jgi:deoxyribonuclease-2
MIHLCFQNNGNGTFPSNCSSDLEYHVMNIEQVEFDFINVNFSVHNDHSKWVVTAKTETRNDDLNKIACIGDINRQTDQLRRGGGTVCFLNNQNVWNEYHKIVSKIEKCPVFNYINIFINVNNHK